MTHLSLPRVTRDGELKLTVHEVLEIFGSSVPGGEDNRWIQIVGVESNATGPIGVGITALDGVLAPFKVLKALFTMEGLARETGAACCTGATVVAVNSVKGSENAIEGDLCASNLRIFVLFFLSGSVAR
ncbi:hypothetical protein U1Q18_024412 [Sarracenia purpurea var. burkii]